MKKALSIILTAIILFTAAAPVTASAATVSQLRSKVVSVASGEVGYAERSKGVTKYGDWYGCQGGWCTTFVLWCYNKAGEAYGTKLYGSIVPNGGNCNSMISWFTNKGRYHKASSGYSPKTGDLVFFDWSSNGSSQHVGIVDYVSGTSVYTIEGNCSGKVKKMSYTQSGSKPYNNISSIMGYAEPDFNSVASGSSGKTTKKKTTAAPKTTAKKTTRKTTKKTTRKTTAAKTTSPKKTTKAATKPTSRATTTAATTTVTETEATTKTIELKELDINASVYNLQIGDSVKLDYSVKPSNAPAVVGYFCDQEGIIELGAGGDIKAVGEGTATVVVCANDTLYKQADFTVTKAVGNVTKVHEGTTGRKVVGKADITVVTTERTAEAVLSRMGVNIDALSQNTHIYIIPLSIIGVTFVISLFAFSARKIKDKLRRRNENRTKNV